MLKRELCCMRLIQSKQICQNLLKLWLCLKIFFLLSNYIKQHMVHVLFHKS